VRASLKLGSAVAAVAGLLAMPAAASAATLFVGTATDSWAVDATCSLREAIEAANTNGNFQGCNFGADDNADTIQLSNGQNYTRSLTGDDTVNAVGDLDIRNEPLTIELGAPGLNATINSNATGDRVLEIGPTGAGITVTISGVNIRGGVNVAGSDGGGMLVSNGSTLNFSQGDVSNNHSLRFGGGIENSGTLNVTNATLTGNVADSLGGGGLDHNGINPTSTLNSVTVFNNSGGDGGGVFRFLGTMNLFNTIVAGNTDTNTTANNRPDCGGTNPTPTGPSSLGFNLIGSTLGCNYTAAGGDVTDTAANLAAATSDNNTFVVPLNPGSPAIDAGALSGVPATDQRGTARPQGARCDMGAYELDAANDSPSCAGPATSGPPPTSIPPGTTPTTGTPTGQRAAALKKCKKKRSAAARRKCRKRAQLLPL
jgi:CSLREA domain-containing protein